MEKIMAKIIKFLKEKKIIDELKKELDPSNIIKLGIDLDDNQKLKYIELIILQKIIVENEEFHKELRKELGDYTGRTIRMASKKVLSIINENDK